MSSCCSAPAPKEEKKFGIKVCRERNCEDLQRDPKYPDSPQRCAVTHGTPGSMSCCVKKMPPEQFIRHISGQLNNSPYDAQRPGPKNCPDICPYKLKKERKCAFTGNDLKSQGGCPCNVLGNPQQEDLIRLLTGIVKSRLECGDDIYRGLCTTGICPDGKDRGAPNTDDDRCPVLRVPLKSLHGSAGCPLWRIPAKTLPKLTQLCQKNLSRVSQKQDKRRKPSLGSRHRKRKSPPGKKKRKLEYRQATLDDFPDDIGKQPAGDTREDCCTNCGHHRGRKSFEETCPRLPDLMFKGGEYSASRLMAETAMDGCPHRIPKPEKPAPVKKKSKKESKIP